MEYCKECNCYGTVFYDHNQGDQVCKNCGVVLESNFIDETPEWDTYEDDGDSKSRAFVSSKFQPFGSSTLAIVGQSREAKSLAAFQRNIMGSNTSNEGIKQIEEYCSKMELSSKVTEEAKEIYHNYDTERKKKNTNKSGKKKKEFFLSVIFLACNKLGAGRTMKEIAEMNKIDEKLVKKHIREISSYISIGQVMTPS